MPWGYWIALVVVGCFGLLNVIAFVISLLQDRASVDIRGPIIWGPITFGVLWAYGLRKAYELSIVNDELEWRTPLRTARYPLTSIVLGEIRSGGVIGERHAILRTDQGRELSVVVPNARHERRFRAFCEAIAARSTTFPGLPLEDPGI
jgi:hypothetical protein